MDIKSILVYIFFMVNFANAGILTDWYNNLNSDVNRVYDELVVEGKLKRPECKFVLRQTESTPKPVYKADPPVVEKKENESELYEICKLRFRSTDFVELAVIQKGYMPFIMHPSTSEISLIVEKSKKLPLISVFTSILGYKHSGVNKKPIGIELDPKVLSKLPKLSNEDIVTLTILRPASKGKSTKVVSHFIDKIIAAPVQQSY